MLFTGNKIDNVTLTEWNSFIKHTSFKNEWFIYNKDKSPNKIIPPIITLTEISQDKHKSISARLNKMIVENLNQELAKLATINNVALARNHIRKFDYTMQIRRLEVQKNNLSSTFIANNVEQELGIKYGKLQPWQFFGKHKTIVNISTSMCLCLILGITNELYAKTSSIKLKLLLLALQLAPIFIALKLNKNSSPEAITNYKKKELLHALDVKINMLNDKLLKLTNIIALSSFDIKPQ